MPAFICNRLRIGMRLQADPTLIYGLGERYEGDLRTVDLRTDGPYNTYTRSGLPPTAIALPGAAAIRATAHPEKTDAIYFVASGKGDGSHIFSATLEQQNAPWRSILRASARRRRRRRNEQELRRPSSQGRFLTIEGIEGVGKTTQIARLSKSLAERAIAHVVTREPGGTPLAEQIRDLVLSARGEGHARCGGAAADVRRARGAPRAI